MKHTLKKTADTTVHVTVTVDEQEFTAAKDAAVKQLARDVKVQGFRTGKVPAHIAEKNLDPNILTNHTVEYALNAALNQLIEAEDLRVLDQPQVEVSKLVPFSLLEFTADIEVVPAVTLGNYKKLTSKLSVEKVKKPEVDDVIERMRQGFAEKTAVSRPAQSGDEVVLDFAGVDSEGQPIEGTTAQDYPLTLGSQAFVPGFEDGIVGHASGENFDIEVTFPKDYHGERLRGAAVTFHISLKTVNEVKLPEVDDAFAKKSGPFDTVKALRQDIERELTEQKKRLANDKLKDDLLGELVEKSKVPVPEILVNDQLAALERDLTQNLMYRGQTLEDYMTAQGYADKQALYDAELRAAAVRRVQAGLVLAELSKAEDISFSRDELEAELAARKAEAPTMADQFDTPEARRDIANRVITAKTIDRLVALNA